MSDLVEKDEVQAMIDDVMHTEEVLQQLIVFVNRHTNCDTSHLKDGTCLVRAADLLERLQQRIKELNLKLIAERKQCKNIVGQLEQEKAAHIEAVKAAIKECKFRVHRGDDYMLEAYQLVLDLLEGERDKL